MILSSRWVQYRLPVLIWAGVLSGVFAGLAFSTIGPTESAVPHAPTSHILHGGRSAGVDWAPNCPQGVR